MTDTTPPTDPARCPVCASPLPSDAPDATCPRCLLAAGLAESPASDADDAGFSKDRLAALFPELEIGEIVGRGGMGVVWRARQRSLSRDVALKILTVGGDDAPAFAERFSREARALARLDHPHIVRVLECGERQGVCFLLMEYVDGATLRDVMRDGDLRAEQALAIVPQICDALQYAHEHGVVHRDIKPENVLIDTKGQVRIADFGLAKLTEGPLPEATLTRAGQVMGTLHYMAPEQIESPLAVDHRADIYSLGVVFYEMLTGELPIGRFDPPSERVQVDVRLDEVVLRALSKRRERRYQSASEVKTEITAIASSVAAPAAAAPTEPPEPLPAGHMPRKLCKKAALGLALELVPIALSVLATMAFGGSRSARGGLGFFALGVPAGLAFLVGLVLCIAGWVDIARSRDRLWGLGFAIPGVLLPFFVPCLAVPFLFLARVSTPPAPPIAPIPAPPVPSDEPMGVVLRAYIDFASAARPLDLEGRLAFVDPNDAGVLRAMDDAGRDAAGRSLRLGLAFVPDDLLPPDLDLFGLKSTASGDAVDASRLHVVVETETHEVEFDLVARIVDGHTTWFLDTSPCSIRPLEDE